MLGASPAGPAAEGWKFADPAYRLELPRDHAAHPAHRIEWWYYTGNVAARDGRRFGYQLTFFRVGVDPAPSNPSRWAVRDLYMAHLAITDIDGGRHRFAERLSRAGIAQAGASADAYRVWIDDWLVTLDEAGRHVLTAGEPGLGVTLRLEPGKPWVAHGERGFSRKGSQPGNATHYYSLTRMPTRGRLVVGEDTLDVEGLSWMDHEFGTSILEPGQVGWDWFSIQLDDGTELMLFQLRRADGGRDPHSSGTYVGPGGEARAVTATDITLAAGRHWRSAASGASYPVVWRLEVAAHQLVLDVRAALPDQELRTAESTGVTYWEGAIEVRGTRAGRAVGGRGYLEMTGYAGAPMSGVLR